MAGCRVPCMIHGLSCSHATTPICMAHTQGSKWLKDEGQFPHTSQCEFYEVEVLIHPEKSIIVQGVHHCAGA